jgi:probable blue pigment (indigoidine) exporter
VARHRRPVGNEWVQVALYGLLNVTIYLGCYVIAMQTVTTGIGALAVTTNPLFIGFISIFFLGQRMDLRCGLAMVICVFGVLCAAWPLLDGATVTPGGLGILLEEC